MIDLKLTDGCTFVTHANCSDGKTCALIAKEYADANGLKINIVFAKYGNEQLIIDKIPAGGDVVFSDFTLSLDGMNTLEEKCNIIAVLDHHKTAEAVLAGKEYATFDMHKCGAALTYEWLHPDEEFTPLMIQYVCDRDLWTWEYELSKPFGEGYSTMTFDYIVENYNLSDILDNHTSRYMDFIHDVIDKGRILLERMEGKVTSIVNRTKDSDVVSFIVDGVERKMWCVNNSEYISEVGNQLSTKMRSDNLVYNASAQYFITDTDIVFSLRSVEDVDISIIAKAFGGGGHAHAAGLSFNLKTFTMNGGFNKLFIDKVIDNKHNK